MSTWAKIILDSVSPYNGKRLTTLEVNYPYIIHGEFMTHCAFARNGASTRAIQTRRLIQRVVDEPFIPTKFPRTANPDRGMSPDGFHEVGSNEHEQAKILWVLGVENAVRLSSELANLGVHKQIASRPLLPFMYQRMVVTATEFENFINLRTDSNAQEEIQVLARCIRDVLTESTPVERTQHLPFVQEGELLVDPYIVSAFRCARISYLQHDGKIDARKDYERGLDLLRNGHMSPFEHQGTAVLRSAEWASGKFRGWQQYRKTLHGEAVWVPTKT